MKTDIKKLILKDIKTAYATLNSTDEDIVLNELASALKNEIKLVIFYNDKLNDNEKIKLAKKLHQLCSIYNALFLVCFRADIAKIIDSDGIFLDNNSISVHQALEIISKEKFIATNYEDDNSDLIIGVNLNDSDCENKIFRI